MTSGCFDARVGSSMGDCLIRVCLMVSKKFTPIANVELMYITFYDN